MSKKQAITPEVGYTVETPKGEGIVMEKKAGWYAVKMREDSEVLKFRATDLKCYAVEVDDGKVVAADDDELEDDGSTRIRANLENYESVKAASGNRSYDNADTVAEMFRGKSLDEVYILAARDLKANGETGITIKGLKERYENLNPGHQRMCVGNRVRAARARAADAEVADNAK